MNDSRIEGAFKVIDLYLGRVEAVSILMSDSNRSIDQVDIKSLGGLIADCVHACREPLERIKEGGAS